MTIELLDGSLGHIDKLLAKYKHVNVIDVGVGNAVPTRPLLKHLLDQGKLARYIALDISSEMIDIAKRNVESWFDGRVNFVGYEADMTYERFGHLLAEDAPTAHVDDTVNLVLLLGGTPDNFRDVDGPFQTIRDSIRPRDIVIYTDKLDTKVSRRFFDFNPDPDSLSNSLQTTALSLTCSTSIHRSIRSKLVLTCKSSSASSACALT